MNNSPLQANLFTGNFFSQIVEFWQVLISFFLPFLILLTLGIVIFYLRKFLILKKVLKEKSVFLEITPPAFTDKGALTTQNFFSVIHGLRQETNPKNWIIGNKTIFSLEIVSTLNQGIRYLIRTTPDEAEIIKKDLLSYLPQAKIKEVSEYLPTNAQLQGKYYKIIEFKQKKHFAYPLQKHELLTEHDPVAYTTGSMTKLSPGDLVSFQIVIAPTVIGETNYIDNLIRKNGDVLGYLNGFRYPNFLKPAVLFFKLFIKLVHGFGDGFITHGLGSLFNNQTTSRTNPNLAYSNHQYYQQIQVQQNLKPERVISAFEKETIQSVQEKINQSLFEATIRAYILVGNKKDLQDRVRGVNSSLAPFSIPRYQSLKKKWNLLPILINPLREWSFKNRLLSLSNKGSNLLSSSELASLYHFPFRSVTQTENLVKSFSKELPAPLSLKRQDNLDIIFAKNKYGGTETLIGLTEEERRRHMYILGATGTGKTTLLTSMIAQDIRNGKGVCVIDPHGDLAESLLNIIPKEREKDVIYFNPLDIKYPIGLNLLELSENLDPDEALIEKEFVTESIISLFHKLYPDKYSGPRMEYILRNTIHTTYVLPQRTLFTIYKMLTNPKFRKSVTSLLTNEDLKDFWKYEFNKAGDYQKVKMISPITNKIGRFLFSPTAKKILEKEKSDINFSEIMDQGKILICNLSKGKLGEDTSEIFGGLLMTKIQLTALARARQDQKDRRDFYLYVDEFQNFATPAFAQILSEARKYRLSAILAHQTTSQLEDKNLVNITLANTGTVICFKTANPEDEVLILPQFYPVVQKGEIANLPAFHFYIKLAALEPQEAFSGETMLVQLISNKDKVKRIIKLSQEQYGSSKNVVSNKEITKTNTSKGKSKNKIK